jgi:recombination protein RecR
MFYPKPLGRLIGELEKLPTVGVKTAQRLAFYILRASNDEARQLAQAIMDVKEQITNCQVCYNYTDQEVCEICRNDRRDRKLLCVVAEPRDLLAIEQTRGYGGLYHVLGGVINPMAGIGPDALRFRELVERVRQDAIQEVIVALNPTVEGEATAHFVKRELEPLGVRLSRIASGIPVGGDMDYSDHATLIQALEGRRPL